MAPYECCCFKCPDSVRDTKAPPFFSAVFSKDFAMGERVECIQDSNGVVKGMIGKIIRWEPQRVEGSLGVEWELSPLVAHSCEGYGKEGYCAWINLEYIKLITASKRERSSRESKKKSMSKINSMMQRLLDKDVKILIKADLIRKDDLLLTDDGREELWSILFQEKKAELVKIAKEKIAGRKKNDDEEEEEEEEEVF